MNQLFTIGYSNHTNESFVLILQKHGINAIVDVRSAPYSKFKPEFNKKNLTGYLKRYNIEYVFLGKECGARFDSPDCYINGRADYNLIAKHTNFLNGLNRIQNGLQTYKIALMCAEKDPVNCHRMILICRNLKKRGINIFHIIDNNLTETQSDSEKRLLRLFAFDQLALFQSDEEQLSQAYDMQGKKIAYKDDTHDPNTGEKEEFNSGAN